MNTRRIASGAERHARKVFPYIANARGECDTCHSEPSPVYREDTDEGWQECERCYSAREGRRAVKHAMREVR